jgi:hypothetical protein
MLIFFFLNQKPHFHVVFRSFSLRGCLSSHSIKNRLVVVVPVGTSRKFLRQLSMSFLIVQSHFWFNLHAKENV